MSDRILELALETLESRKAAIQAEIEQLRAQMRGGRSSASAPKAEAPVSKKAAVRTRRPRSAAARKAQSLRMKEYWAKRRAESAGKGAAKKNGRE